MTHWRDSNSSRLLTILTQACPWTLSSSSKTPSNKRSLNMSRSGNSDRWLTALGFLFFFLFPFSFFNDVVLSRVSYPLIKALALWILISFHHPNLNWLHLDFAVWLTSLSHHATKDRDKRGCQMDLEQSSCLRQLNPDSSQRKIKLLFVFNQQEY